MLVEGMYGVVVHVDGSGGMKRVVVHGGCSAKAWGGGVRWW